MGVGLLSLHEINKVSEDVPLCSGKQSWRRVNVDGSSQSRHGCRAIAQFQQDLLLTLAAMCKQPLAACIGLRDRGAVPGIEDTRI